MLISQRRLAIHLTQQQSRAKAVGKCMIAPISQRPTQENPSDVESGWAVVVCSKRPFPPSSGTSVRGVCRVVPAEHYQWPNPAETTRAPDPIGIRPDLAPKVATFASRLEVHKQWPGGRVDSAGFGQSNAIWPEPSSRRFPSGSSRVSQARAVGNRT